MRTLEFIVKTPVQEIVRTAARSVRVLTETGQVGLRPRMEGVVLAVEPGLALVFEDELTRFVGTAGGLLTCDGRTAVLLTPLAVAATDEVAVTRRLTELLQNPGAELEVRNTINNIQKSILGELKEDRRRRGIPGEVG
jgi:F0F1-type ATP synthase epsilon subunit